LGINKFLLKGGHKKMTIALLSWITGLWALIFLLAGFIAVFFRGGLGSSIRSVFGIIPIGNPKLWGVIFIVLGLMFGGLAYGWNQISGLTAGIGTATTIGTTPTTSQLTNCRFQYASASKDAGVAGAVATVDTSDLSHYYYYTKATNGSVSLNGTISCDRTGDIDKAYATNCWIVSDSFRSESSTTDSNTYYTIATSSTKSKVPGFPWAQTAYLQSGAVATTASDQEVTQIVFTGGSGAIATQQLGYYFTLPGQTAFNYLNNQTSKDVNIYCDGNQKVGRITIQKIA
jgi:hypothetical protein